jgi:hypothetical protein
MTLTAQANDISNWVHVMITNLDTMDAGDAFARALMRPPELRRNFDCTGWFTPSHAQRASELMEAHQKAMETDPAGFVKALIRNMELEVSDAEYEAKNK